MWATAREAGGPGKAFSAYLPKSATTISEKLRPTLEKLRDHSPVLKMREKRTGFDIWKATGIRSGSHYPLLVYTDTPGRRRTPTGLARRKEKWQAHVAKRTTRSSSNSQRWVKSEPWWSRNSQWRGKPQSQNSRQSWQESTNARSWTPFREKDPWARNTSTKDRNTWWDARDWSCIPKDQPMYIPYTG